MSNGLDGRTVVSDLTDLSEDPNRFGWGVPEYVEDLEKRPETVREARQPAELVLRLRDVLRTQAHRLARDMTATTENIRASAELRQAVANTIVQRRLLTLTIFAQ